MYKILIVSALSQELNPIKDKIKELKKTNLKISYFSSGMWNYNMILNLTRFLEKNDFDFVINIWVCGYIKEKLDFFQVARIFNFSNKKEVLVPKILDFWKLESILCSELPVSDRNILWEEKFVDMESYGFEKVLDSFSIPRAIFKIAVDKIWTGDFDFKKSKKFLEENIDYDELLEKIIWYLEKNKKEEFDFSSYFSFYNFTFSEKELFKKLVFRYNSLVWKDFLAFFEKNNSLNKKEFLSFLKKYLDKYLIK